MGAKVGKVDMSGVKSKLDAIKTDEQLGAFASTQAARIMGPFVPKDTGTLMNSTGASEPWKVVYDTPYARRQYYGEGFNFSAQENPKAKAKWDEGPDWQELGNLITEKLRSM